MASETQYYQAKVFLKSYNDALQTLDDVYRNQALLAKNISYKDFLLGGHARREITIRNGELIKQKNFEHSKIRNLGAFSASNFAKDLARFESVENIGGLIKLLEEKLA